jgi:hypothetical protein
MAIVFSFFANILFLEIEKTQIYFPIKIKILLVCITYQSILFLEFSEE